MNTNRPPSPKNYPQAEWYNFFIPGPQDPNRWEFVATVKSPGLATSVCNLLRLIYGPENIDFTAGWKPTHTPEPPATLTAIHGPYTPPDRPHITPRPYTTDEGQDQPDEAEEDENNSAYTQEFDEYTDATPGL